MTDSIAENIRNLMASEGITASDLSRKTGIDRSVLHKILNGATKNPTIDSIKALIKHYSFDEVVFGVNQSEKLGEDEIPIISWLEASTVSQNSFSSKRKTVKTNIKTSQSSFALAIDETLDSRFQKNTVLIIDPMRVPKNKSYILVQENDSSLPLIKRYILEGNTAYLKPIDPSLPSSKYEKEKFKIIGVVIQSILDFEE